MNTELYTICKRKNNTKRNYLLVNNKQGKHIPVAASEVYNLVTKLSDTYKQRVEEGNFKKVLVIGFAETATALGTIFATNLAEVDGLEVNYITTTREQLKAKNVINFSEEHSHAVNQLLYTDNWVRLTADTDEIVFVEDEISTGKTIKNIVESLRKNNLTKLMKNQTSVVVASILNGMSEESKKLFYYDDIKFIYSEKIDNKNYTSMADKISTTEERSYDLTTILSNVPLLNIEYKDIALTTNFRLGTSVNELNEELMASLEDCMKEFKLINKARKKPLNIRVIGTEECMHPAIALAKLLENNNDIVKTHSTTRSPIEVSKDSGYTIRSSYKIASMYNKQRDTYIYNLDDNLDVGIIVSDCKDTTLEGLKSVAFALRMNKCKRIIYINIKYAEGKYSEHSED